MTRSLPWTPAHYAGLIDPQPREPGNGSTFKSPNRPRPPKPVQPRDDGCSRIPNACFAAAASGGNDGPQPRDPGNGRRMRVDPQPRDPGNGRYALIDSVGGCEVPAAQVCGGGGPKPPREPRPPQPREGGRRFARCVAPQPRDPG
ncbi:hypothetical protein KC343_g18188 [Hortaea werneckii]|uniref:Uncharacterized protein n=1 Tax=Hortaea werneckii TaxID=91943 RepID=A0A3M7GU47_HORWE|nr:hypothetical protein KC352_g33268 [Hortaea werneckii]KAI7536997.1 hypothetical protein KC317_g18225 [Hortaea werneckii]KAI7583478.1 hypothetical protein KC346_g18177 [Hortaea werneckii]KAI7591299.1 hypothetical protein KC343_g18188 [Hortaea werneckii]KAI7624587.1 hypothetical protein KC319_g17896 [Hortaea werneckii]